MGIHNYAPFVVAILPILIAMTLVLKGKIHYNIVALILMIISSGTHPSGIVMSGVAVCLSFFSNNKRFSIQQILFYLSSFIVFIFYFFQIKFITPEIVLSELYKDHDIINFLRQNINTGLELIRWDGQIFLNKYICLVFFSLGSFAIYKDKFNHNQILPLFITISFLVFLSVVFPSPTVSLFKRTWLIISLFLIGVMGYGLNVCLNEFYKFLKVKKMFSFKDFLIVVNQNRSYLALFILLVLFYITSVNNVRQKYMWILDNHIWDANITLNKNQSDYVVKNTRKNDKVLFHFPNIELSEPIIYNFLVNGGNRVANIWPILNPFFQNEIDHNIKFMFSLNPMTAIDEGKIQQPYFYRKKKLFITGDIFIVERDNLKFEFKDVPKFLKIYVENNSREAVLFDQKLKIKSIIPEHFRGWINLNLGDSFNDKEIIIYAENIRKPIRILGFKTNDFQKTYYPWNSGFSFEKIM